jgi:hypothetical protein
VFVSGHNFRVPPPPIKTASQGCTMSPELHLLCKVVVVFAFITVCSNQRHSFGLQRFSVFLVAQRELRSPGHDIGRKGTAFIRSREQQSATALQDAGNFLDQSALDFRIEQKEEAPGNHAIKSSTLIRALAKGFLDKNSLDSGMGSRVDTPHGEK